jgi:inorganic phosphate transporter, PiT family
LAQVWGVLVALLISPVLGLVLSIVVYVVLKFTVRRRDLYLPPEGDRPPIWWIRALLITTCTGVSFSHGTNDGQKSIGLIMLTIIGLMPTAYALNLSMTQAQIREVATQSPVAAELIRRIGGGRKEQAIASASALARRFSELSSVADIPPEQRTSVRNDLNEMLSSLREASAKSNVSEVDRKNAKIEHDRLLHSVEYAPWWVRILSAFCLGAGTMIGYRRIVKTLGERLGKTHLVPAQGASAALVGYAGFGGYPVSTTHVVTGGIAGTMLASGAGLQRSTLSLIGVAWVLTLPATIAMSCGLFLLLR